MFTSLKKAVEAYYSLLTNTVPAELHGSQLPSNLEPKSTVVFLFILKLVFDGLQPALTFY